MYSNWYKNPTSISYCLQDIDSLIFIDENGDNSFKYINKCIKDRVEPNLNNIFFTVTGVIIDKSYLNHISNNIMDIKNRYWDNGLYKYKNKYKRVCFHSRDIRKGKGPFKFNSTYAKEDFFADLNRFMESLNVNIISININKYDMRNKYTNPYDPYEISTQFIMERFYFKLVEENKTGAIILESRGKNEDKQLLDRIVHILNNGSGNGRKEYISSSELNKYIKGVFFNNKWANEYDELKSYFCLEIADLISYPIHKCVRNDFKEDKAFRCIKEKINNYPNIIGHGLKVFP